MTAKLLERRNDHSDNGVQDGSDSQDEMTCSAPETEVEALILMKQ